MIIFGKMLITRHMMDPIDFHSIILFIFSQYGSQWGPVLVTDILQHITFCVQQNKETHWRWEWMTESLFLGLSQKKIQWMEF